MYLYFDRVGKLKEIINDEALRQGNYNVNKMYVYVDRNDVSSIDVSYLLPSGLIVGPENITKKTTAEIPFDRKRDLLYFKYYKEYTFVEIDLSKQDLNDHTALEEAGLVHCSLIAILNNSSQLALGDVNFNVEVDEVLNQHYVASQEYLSLSDYQFLRSLIDKQIIDATDFTATTQLETLIDRMDGQMSALVRFPESISNYAETKYYGLCLVNLYNTSDTYYNVSIDNGNIKYYATNRPSNADIFNINQKVEHLYLNSIAFTLVISSQPYIIHFNLYSKTDITGATTLNALYNYLANSDSAVITTTIDCHINTASLGTPVNVITAKLSLGYTTPGNERYISVAYTTKDGIYNNISMSLTTAITISKIEII